MSRLSILASAINRLKQAAKVAPKVTKGMGGARTGAKVTQGAGGAAKAPGMFSNPLQTAAAPFKTVGGILISNPAKTIYAGAGLGGLVTGGIVAAENQLNPKSITNINNRAIGEAREWDTRTGTIQAPDIGDRLIDLLTGTDREKLRDEARKIRQGDFKKKNDVLIEALNKGENGFILSEGLLEDGKIALGDTANSESYKNKLETELKRLKTYQQLKEEGVTGLTGGMSETQMNAQANRYRKTLPTSAESMLQRQLAREAYNQEQARLDRIYNQEVLDYNERKSDARLAFQEQQAQLNRQQTMKLNLLQQQNLNEDRRDRRADADRRDRRETIALIMQGLGALGGSIVA